MDQNQLIAVATELYMSALVEGSTCPSCVIRQVARDEGLTEKEAAMLVSKVTHIAQHRNALIH